MEYHKILTLEPLKGTFLIDGILTEKTEVFKDIPDYKGSYQISTFGRVKSLKLNIIRKQSLDGKRYLQIGFHHKRKYKTFKIAKLVAITFLNHKPDGWKTVIDHIDNIPEHNWL